VVTLITKSFINAVTQIACYFLRSVQILSFWTDFCQSTFWKFVQANRFGSFGRTADRGDAATNCCSPVNRNCTTLCCVHTWFFAVARRTDVHLHCLGMQLRAVPTGVADVLMCKLTQSANLFLIVIQLIGGEGIWMHWSSCKFCFLSRQFVRLTTILYVWNTHRSCA